MPNGNDRLPEATSEKEKPTEDTKPQSGVPLSRRRMLQASATGVLGAFALGTASAGASDHPNTIIFDGTVSRGKSAYEFAVTGGIEPYPDAGALEVKDTIDGSSASGAVHRDKDAYRFSGELTALDIKGSADVSITYGDETDVEADRLEIVAESGASIDYSFTASDKIVPIEDTVESEDSVVENSDGTWTAAGSTADGGGDTFDFWGDILDFAPMDGAYTLFLNGEVVTSYELTGETPSSQLIIDTPSDGSVEYTFTTTGEITKDLDNGDLSAEPENDTVVQNDDGTWTASGLTGNGYGDTYDFEGDVVAFEPKEGSFTLYLDGTEVTAYELVGEEEPVHQLIIDTPSDGSVEYTFTTTGEITKDLDNGDLSAEPENDTVVQNDDGTWTASGLTGNGYGDTYEFEGDATAFDPKEGSFTLYLDGVQVTPYELIGEEEEDTTDSTSDGPAIGGGSGYSNTVAQSEADVVARTSGELADALSSASSGDIVYVPGSESIAMGDQEYDIPDGVTLASDRGIDGSAGALLSTEYEVGELLRLHGSARLTGVRVAGPHPGDDWSGSSSAGGAETLGAGEIDNCEVWGFSHHGVQADSGDGAYIHHNVIRENNTSGLGYGVACSSGSPVIEYNYFNYNRHSVATGGDNPGYTVRYNHFGPKEVMHNIDMHDPAGTRYDIHNNVVETVYREWDDNVNHIVSVRGVPDDLAYITDNWFFNPNAPDPDGPTDEAGQAVIQPNEDQWTNVDFPSNYYGEDASVTYSDIIPGYDGSRTA